MTLKNRFDTGAPGMLPDGSINTLGPDGKPTHPIKVYFPDGTVKTAEEMEEPEDDLSDLSDLEAIAEEVGK